MTDASTDAAPMTTFLDDLRWGRGTRLLVRFEGETEPVSIRPHLLRVLDS